MTLQEYKTIYNNLKLETLKKEFLKIDFQRGLKSIQKLEDAYLNVTTDQEYVFNGNPNTPVIKLKDEDIEIKRTLKKELSNNILDFSYRLGFFQALAIYSDITKVFIKIRLKTKILEGTKTQLKDVYKVLERVEIKYLINNKPEHRREITDEEINTLKAEIKFKIENNLFTDLDQRDIDEEKLSLKQIALIHAYTKSNITDHNKNDIAKKNGWNSGHKLKQLFDKHYYRTVDRIGTEDTKKKTENKIELFESVIDLIPKDNQKQVLSEIKSLKDAMSKEYL